MTATSCRLAPARAQDPKSRTGCGRATRCVRGAPVLFVAACLDLWCSCSCCRFGTQRGKRASPAANATISPRRRVLFVSRGAPVAVHVRRIVMLVVLVAGFVVPLAGQRQNATADITTVVHPSSREKKSSVLLRRAQGVWPPPVVASARAAQEAGRPHTRLTRATTRPRRPRPSLGPLNHTRRVELARSGSTPLVSLSYSMFNDARSRRTAGKGRHLSWRGLPSTAVPVLPRGVRASGCSREARFTTRVICLAPGCGLLQHTSS